MRDHSLGQPYAAAFEAGPGPQWRAVTQKLRAEGTLLRQAFLESAGDTKSSAAPATLENFEGIGVDFVAGEPGPELRDALCELRGKPVKLTAGGVGQKRFLDEVLPLLARLDDSCPVVLDARNNGLDRDALSRLTRIIRQSRNLYSIDLSGNPLCDDALCPALVELMAMASPLRRLVLQDIGCSDALAVKIAVQLQKHRFLVHLDLRNNHINAQGAKALVGAVTARDLAINAGDSGYYPVDKLQLQGNPVSTQSRPALDKNIRRARRCAVHAQAALRTKANGYFHMGELGDLQKAVDAHNGVSAAREREAGRSCRIELGAPADVASHDRKNDNFDL